MAATTFSPFSLCLGALGGDPLLHPEKLEVFNGTGSGEYLKGKKVEMHVKPMEGYEFVRWFLVSGDGELKDEESEEATYTMGIELAKVVAVMAKANTWFPPGDEESKKGGFFWQRWREVNLVA